MNYVTSIDKKCSCQISVHILQQGIIAVKSTSRLEAGTSYEATNPQSTVDFQDSQRNVEYRCASRYYCPVCFLCTVMLK